MPLYEPVSGPNTGGNLWQSLFTEITVDTTIASTTFATLLSRTITISAGNVVLIHFSEANSSSSGSAVTFFRLTIDAVVIRAAGTRSPAVGDPQGVSLVYRATGLAAGLHTVLIEWKNSSGTSRIRPVTVPDAEFAGLLVEEVSN